MLKPQGEASSNLIGRRASDFSTRRTSGLGHWPFGLGRSASTVRHWAWSLGI